MNRSEFSLDKDRLRSLRTLPLLSEQNVLEPAIRAFFETATAQESLKWAIDRWNDRLALVTSFQAGGMVLLDMAWRIDPKIRVVTLDTGRLPQESYRFIDRVRERYGVEIEMFFPDMRLVQGMVRESGPDLFYHSVDHRQRCCYVRKVEPLQRALDGTAAWVTGLRREQNASRAKIGKVDLDPQDRSRFKFSPLADWTHERVWSYLRTHKVPTHPLYDRGYTSIGCAPCTRPTQAGEDRRAGRWWWERGGESECGLHLNPSQISGGDRQNLTSVPHRPQLVQLTRKAS